MDEVREQRRQRRRVTHSSWQEGRDHRAEHPEPGVDVLRLRREPAGDPDERQQRDGVHSAQITSTPKLQLPTPNTRIWELGSWELVVDARSRSERQQLAQTAL